MQHPEDCRARRGSREIDALVSALRVLLLIEEINWETLCLFPNGCPSWVRPGSCKQE